MFTHFKERGILKDFDKTLVGVENQVLTNLTAGSGGRPV
jgi:hypothetical protein